MLDKLISGAVVSLILSSTSNATDSLYVGVNFGKAALNIDLERSLAIGSRDKSNLGNASTMAGAFIGYNHTISGTPLFVGLEGGVANHRLDMKKEENTFPPYVNYVTTVKTDNAFFGIAKVGVIIRDLLGYVKVGTSTANWRVNFKDQSNPNVKSESTRKFNGSAFISGFGVDYRLNPNWVMGIDHTVYDYKELNLSHAVGEFKISPTLHTTTARLIYSF